MDKLASKVILHHFLHLVEAVRFVISQQFDQFFHQFALFAEDVRCLDVNNKFNNKKIYQVSFTLYVQNNNYTTASMCELLSKKYS